MLSDAIFDTLVDTKKMFVPMKTRIIRRGYINAQGRSQLYLHVTANSKRERIPLDIYVPHHLWDPKSSRVKDNLQVARDINLVLDNIDSKITGIRTLYRLENKVLTPERFIEEFRNSIPRVDFIAFMDYQLQLERKLLAKGSYKRINTVINKLRQWRTKIYFTELDAQLIMKLRSHLKSIGNSSTTIETNMAVVKKYITAAKKNGIRMAIEPWEVKAGSTRGNRTYLQPEEVKLIHEYYTCGFINPRHKLVAGYFLFSCFTGLRISDVQQLTRQVLSEDLFSFISTKTKKKQWIRISNKLREILLADSRLFEKKVSDPEMNRTLKEICTTCGIHKKVSFHVGRHTFATNFLRMGGDVQTLQSLLGHSKITETMIYVHIVNSEACEKISLLDNLF